MGFEFHHVKARSLHGDNQEMIFTLGKILTINCRRKVGVEMAYMPQRWISGW